MQKTAAMKGNWAIQENRFGFEPKMTTFNFKPISQSRRESIEVGLNINSSDLATEQTKQPEVVEQP